MKPSPLQLKWVSYPEASYEFVEEFEGSIIPTPAEVDAEVTWSLDGDHMAMLKISANHDGQAPYRFSVTAMAAFSFDLETARAEYRPHVTQALPPILAVNVSRILYAGAREHIAMMTARGPFGAVVLESVMLEPQDVRLGSASSPVEIFDKVFGASQEELETIRSRLQQKKLERTKKPRASKKAS